MVTCPRRFLMRLAIACMTGIVLPVLAAEPSGSAPGAPIRQLKLGNKPWTGDLDAIVERRMLRVLVPHSRSLYYQDKGHERGLTVELVRDFERYLNQKYKTGKRPLTAYIIPTTRDKLLTGVAEGLGDIAAGNLTVTEDRLRTLDFVVQAERRVNEVVVTSASVPPLESVEALAGRTVHVREASSYHESLVNLNARFRASGRPEVRMLLVPDALEDEDMLEMTDAGLIDVMIIDDWKAKMWAPVLPKVRVNDVALREAGSVGWGIRKGSPQLADAIADFDRGFGRTRASYEYRLKQSMRRVKQTKNPTQSAEWRRFQEVQQLFVRYGERYGFDPVMLAAQGFQESRLDQNARSHVGAIGVMQIMPATGAQMRVGDITVTEPNIHAGVKYMDQLMRVYFPDARFSEGNRPLFAFASYNAGPGNISRCRNEARKRGLDPDKWFNNVELVVAERIGIETTTYVRNIYKYYVTYKLSLEAQASRRAAMEALQQAGGR